MNNRLQERLLRAYVRQILLEQGGGEGGGGGGGGGEGGGGPTLMGDPRYGGALYANLGQRWKELGSAFTSPFQTAAAEVSKLSARLQTAFKGVFEFMKSMIKGTKADYERIFREQDEKINKINEKYKDVYELTKKAFTTGDFAPSAALCYPGVVFGALAAKKSPELALKFIDMIGGENETLKKFTSNMRKKISSNESVTGKTVTDEIKKSENSNVREQLSQAMDTVGKDYRGAMTTTLEKVYQSAEKILKASSLEEIKNIINYTNPEKGFEMTAEVEKSFQKIRTSKDATQTYKESLKNTKDSIKQFYIKSLEEKKKQATGVSSVIEMYDVTIKKIKSISY